MKTLKIDASESTPSVFFNIKRGLLIISGRSYPENPNKFYNQIVEHFNDIETNSIQITFEFEYVNTSSTKCILQLLKDLNKIKDVNVIWHSEIDDEDINDLGEYLQEFTKIPFEFRIFQENIF